MTHLGATEASQFAQRWLPAWTGNDPERLAASSDDALYIALAALASIDVIRIAVRTEGSDARMDLP